MGRRIEKAVTENTITTTTRYLYDGFNILAEYDENNNVKAQYIHNLGIDDQLAMVKNGQTYYYHKDGLGSVVALTDNAGNVAQTYSYDSFGNITNQTGSLIQPFMFTGREYDSESGLYYLRARELDSKTGTFTQKDPIGFGAGDTNLYRYVKNRPTVLIDPLGLYGEDVHHDLTYQLAVQAGFKEHDAKAIAKYNQGTDEFFFTAWYYPFGGIQKHFMSHEYATHNLDGGAFKVHSLAYFGEALHILQDSYSHAGYKWYKLGHLKDSTSPDKLCITSKRDISMIYETWLYLLKYRQIYYKTGKEIK